MIALIVGNGDVSPKVLEAIPANPFVICADGGIRHIKMLGLRADIVIGDMDSAEGELGTQKNIVYPTKKDFSDSEIAVNYALDNGYDEIVMLGFTGTRLDHTLTNLFLLREIHRRGAKGTLIDANNTVCYAAKENEIYGKKGDIISIIPIGGDVLGITSEGLEYPLKNETLFYGKSRGVSNVMEKELCRISIKKGDALIIKSTD